VIDDSIGQLAVEGVSKWFRTPRASVHALDNVTLTVAPGEFLCLVGPSGCGKSTLLDIIAGLTAPDSGNVFADGQPVIGPGRHRLVMFQESALFPWLDVFGNVMFGLKRDQNLTRQQKQEVAEHHLELVGLTKFKKAYTHELSGGMKQRVGLARALATDPNVLLMDEPFAALDAQTRDLMQVELLRIWQTAKKTVLFVTHQIEEAIYLSDRVMVMTKRPGRAKKIFKIDLPRPRDYEMRVTPEFNELKLEIWNELKDEITV
jgi:NitT/TauT family transport system ATP-binding protein